MGKLLDPHDKDLMFNEIWTPMLGYIGVHLLKKSIPILNLQDPIAHQVYLATLGQISEKMWKKRRLIDRYLEEKKAQLPPEHVQIIQEWKQKAIHDQFIVVDHTPDGSVLANQAGYFLVKGVNSTWEELTARMPLPVAVTTTLLPWKNCITTSGLVSMALFPIPSDSVSIIDVLAEYSRNKAKGAIITQL